MKDTIIILFLLAIGFIAGIFAERQHPEWTRKYVPSFSASTEYHYQLLQAGPSGVEETSFKLILHEGGGVTWEKAPTLFSKDNIFLYSEPK
jgi:hypothetical protein